MAGREAQEEEEEEEKEVLTGHGKGPGAAGTVQDLPGGGGGRAWHTHMSTGMPQRYCGFDSKPPTKRV